MVPENHRKPTEMKNGIPERQGWLSEGCCHREESEMTDGVATICSEWTENNVFVCLRVFVYTAAGAGFRRSTEPTRQNYFYIPS